MTMRRVATTIVVVLGLAATATGNATTAGVPVVDASLNPTLKTRILVDSRGRTLYLVTSELRNQPACVGSCAKLWPPLLTTGKPKAGPGARQALIGTAKRPDGKLQVTYGGHPLYYWAGGSGNGLGDRKPGDVEGQSRFDVWWVVSPAGTAVRKRV